MSRVRSLILLLTGVTIVLLMVHLVGTGDVIEVLRKADPLFFGIAVVFQFAALTLWAVRWKILLRSFQPVALRNALKGILIGLFFNNITPVARAGGEPFRAYYIERRETIDFEDAFAAVAIDRVLDSLPFMAIIAFSLLYFIFILEISFEMIIFLSLAFIFNVVLLSLVLYFSFSLGAAKKLMFSILRFVSRFSNRLQEYESQVEEAVEQYHTAVKMLSSRKRDLAVSLAISFVFWFLAILRNYLVVMALGYHVNFMAIVVVQTVGTLAGVLPILPGGLGSIDGIMVFLYLSFNFPAVLAVTASLLDRFISFWITTAVGGACVFVERDFLKNEST
ncbi:MAG: flippase-like domain-containing protein [Theionarchaea archaeon]|nr:MAG: hypothetical protein AYK18_10325 [Theionarchaea archaeon DG-70]MBU7009462.1 flippase-like domain-containing protein [Theionarchaea archaeon]